MKSEFLEFVRDCSSVDDLIIPTKFSYLDLDNKCLIYRIKINEETFNHFSNKKNIKKFLTHTIIENTLYGCAGIASDDSYVAYYKEKEYILNIPRYECYFDIDYNFGIDYDLTEVITSENKDYSFVVAFKFDIREDEFQCLVDSLEVV